MRQRLVRALFVGVWIVALLLAMLVSLPTVLVFPKAPLWSALSFLLALPVTLVALKSIRASGILALVLFAWDVVSTTWPHITVLGLLDSLTDILLLIITALLAFVAAVSPYRSVFGPKRHPKPTFDPSHP